MAHNQSKQIDGIRTNAKSVPTGDPAQLIPDGTMMVSSSRFCPVARRGTLP